MFTSLSQILYSDSLIPKKGKQNKHTKLTKAKQENNKN